MSDQRILRIFLRQVIWPKMHDETNMLADTSARLGLTINRRKSKVFMTNASINIPITVQREALE
ncbi:hypothetical protein DPMN_147424 [Dreissena polymorpha]|uniref:Uncharacterized protein n=1 Tax=Dreissena polymorpha TaxID=45954 RepID=A0A9D4F7R3_DREPO|nr:hypothetical protein DPMN_147424 [Dreissena polymorpha]